VAGWFLGGWPTGGRTRRSKGLEALAVGAIAAFPCARLAGVRRFAPSAPILLPSLSLKRR